MRIFLPFSPPARSTVEGRVALAQNNDQAELANINKRVAGKHVYKQNVGDVCCGRNEVLL